METDRAEILTIDLLKMGYTGGKQTMLLMPPLSASACKGELIAVIGRNGIGKLCFVRHIYRWTTMSFCS